MKVLLLRAQFEFDYVIIFRYGPFVAVCKTIGRSRLACTASVIRTSVIIGTEDALKIVTSSRELKLKRALMRTEWTLTWCLLS